MREIYQATIALALVLVAPFAAWADDGARPALAVMPLTGDSVSAATRRSLDRLLITWVDKLAPYDSISPAELEAQLQRARLKDEAGCDIESTACAAEIIGALGTRYLLAGSLDRLAGELRIALALTDTRDQKVLARGHARVVNDESVYERAIEIAVRDAFGLEPTNLSDAEMARKGYVAIPKVDVEFSSAAGLADINIAAERQLEVALGAQEFGKSEEEIQQAWCDLATISQHPYEEMAREACAKWRAYFDKRRLLETGRQHEFTILREYLTLERKSDEQRQRAVLAFLEKYGSAAAPEVREAVALRETLAAAQKPQVLEDGACRKTAACRQEGLCFTGMYACHASAVKAASVTPEGTRLKPAWPMSVGGRLGLMSPKDFGLVSLSVWGGYRFRLLSARAISPFAVLGVELGVMKTAELNAGGRDGFDTWTVGPTLRMGVDWLTAELPIPTGALYAVGTYVFDIGRRFEHGVRAGLGVSAVPLAFLLYLPNSLEVTHDFYWLGSQVERLWHLHVGWMF